MPRYTPLTAVDEKIRDLAERKKIEEPVTSVYLAKEDKKTAETRNSDPSTSSAPAKKTSPR